MNFCAMWAVFAAGSLILCMPCVAFTWVNRKGGMAEVLPPLIGACLMFTAVVFFSALVALTWPAAVLCAGG